MLTRAVGVAARRGGPTEVELTLTPAAIGAGAGWTGARWGRQSGAVSRRSTALAVIFVSAAMATKVFSCGPQDDLAAAEALMGKYRVRRLAVVDKGRRPVGVLSLNDLARYACGAKKSSVEREEILRTLASICEPSSGSPHAATTRAA